MTQRVVTQLLESGIAVVTLNRADKMNALDLDMFEAIAAAGESLRKNRAVRAVVLHGDGRAFCAGLDLSVMADGSLDTKKLGSAAIGKAPNFYQKVAWVWKQVPVPVIAAVHGACIGGGLQIALGADIRYMHPDTQLSIMEGKWGLIPDMAGPQILRDLCRADIAKELTFTGKLFDGEQALRYGIATGVYEEPLIAAMECAQQIISRSPDVAVYAKQLFEEGWQGSREAGLLLEETLQAQLLGAANQREAVAAGMAQRPPRFGERAQDEFYEGERFTR